MSIIPNKDEIKGNYEQAKGKIKEEYGDLTDDTVLETEGKAQQVAGKVQEEYGERTGDIGDTAADKTENLREDTDDFLDRAKGKIRDWDEDLRKI